MTSLNNRSHIRVEAMSESNCSFQYASAPEETCTLRVFEKSDMYEFKHGINSTLVASPGSPKTNITLNSEFDGILLDYSRQRATPETLAASLKEKINRMFAGEHINSTENRSVLHVALHAPRDAVIQSDGKNVVLDVGATGKALKDVIAVGIGGSFLGPKQV
ncbi:glucose-6-phosphate isomerase, cytosolic-like [Prunus persica]|uniref:glucose-6-phosphate isomerase, cytosolic-like n=1 Tax=Prunus persica TaxID=3760 RepID=UPI0009AB38B7|nr:glucose-6-phosphate isomerase, cytosolic-like [Prunus persica]